MAASVPVDAESRSPPNQKTSGPPEPMNSESRSNHRQARRGAAGFNNPDTDGDGISDRDEVLLGTNPLVDESAQSSGRLNYEYNGAGWLRVVAGVTGAGFGFDGEGNILQATP